MNARVRLVRHADLVGRRGARGEREDQDGFEGHVVRLRGANRLFARHLAGVEVKSERTVSGYLRPLRGRGATPGVVGAVTHLICRVRAYVASTCFRGNDNS